MIGRWLCIAHKLEERLVRAVGAPLTSLTNQQLWQRVDVPDFEVPRSAKSNVLAS